MTSAQELDRDLEFLNGLAKEFDRDTRPWNIVWKHIDRVLDERAVIVKESN